MRKLLSLVLLVAIFTGCDAKESRVSTDNLIALSWQKGFCKLNKHKRECKSIKKDSFEANNFVLHGLWPQPKSKKYCKGKKKSRVENELYKKLKIVMPGTRSGLHKHEWKKHGTCYGGGVDRYYKDSIKLLKAVNQTKLREFFVKNQGKIVKKEQLNRLFDYPRKFNMICKKGVITELRFALKGDIGSSNLSTLLKAAKPLHGGCKRGKIVGY
ncbi:MAG TPA: hypothetical protein EYG69_05195 [Campylobacterales bacterium]|nr:hypothetical protein [Campylobacterales bacterium]